MGSPTFMKISNTIVFAFFLSSSIYDAAGPEAVFGYGQHPTYITPAPFAFGIWALIHFLFFGFIVWQWFGSESEDIVVNSYESHFQIAGLLTALWNYFWTSGHLVIAFIIMMFTSSSVSKIYHNLSERKAQTLTQRIFVYAPISLFHGWLVVVSCLNFFAIFSTAHDNSHPSLMASIFALLVLLFLTSIAVGYTFYRNEEGDIAGAFVIAWTLFAIAVEQQNPVIHWSALVMAIVVCIYAAQSQYQKKSLLSENQPLLGAGSV